MLPAYRKIVHVRSGESEDSEVTVNIYPSLEFIPDEVIVKYAITNTTNGDSNFASVYCPQIYGEGPLVTVLDSRPLTPDLHYPIGRALTGALTLRFDHSDPTDAGTYATETVITLEFVKYSV